MGMHSRSLLALWCIIKSQADLETIVSSLTKNENEFSAFVNAFLLSSVVILPVSDRHIPPKKPFL
jgi:hypothetical protein